ncbi:MAG: T9SS type A sorting domain-containing protein [Bacteroidota bacterium]
MKNNYFFLFLKNSFCLLAVFLLTLNNTSIAQSASSYGFSASSGTFTYLSGGTSVSTLLDDDVTATVPIGFTFNYCGTGYTQLKPCSNGWISFNTSTTSILWTNSLTNLNTIKPALLPFFDDMTGYGAGADVTYATTGSAGSRVFTLEYKNWDADYSYENTLSFQIKLYEATGVIQYIYQQESGYFGGYNSTTIGIGDGAATPTYLSLNGLGSSPTASSTTFTTSLNGRPANGQVYQFTPPVVCTGTPTAGATSASSSSICFGASTTLSLPTASAGAGISYQWQSSPDNIVAYTNIAGAVSSTYVASPSSSIYYRCVVTCSSGPTSVNSTPVQITFANSVLTTTPGVRCGTGTVSLSATGSTGTTMKWYAAATGGASLGSGSPFTTPTISSTTNYYVAAETNASGIGQIGSGTSLTSSTSYPTAFGNYWYQEWQQIVYTAAELNAAGLGAGNITALAFNISGLPGPGSVSGYNLKIGTTTGTTISSFTTTGLTNVFGPSTVTPASGWNTVTLSTPYNWDGTSNIIVDIRANGAYGSANATTYYTSTSGTTCLYAYTSSSTIGSGFFTSSPTPSTSTSRPNIRFTGNLVCSSPRVTVAATVNTPPAFSISGTQTICNNTVATLSVSSTLSNFNTYVWSPATSLYTDLACTVAYTAGSSASTVYYKSSTAGAITYTCNANNTTSLCASTATVTITNLPSSVAVVATPSNLCVSGNTTLALSPATGYGAAQFQWQSSSDNSSFSDSASMTGTSLTTKMLTASRYYRVVLKNSSGTFCLNSTSDTALVYNPSVSSVTPASRCGFGSVTLAATAIDGTIDWFAASSGGTSLGSGTSFTTPSLGSTTTYYAEVRATPDISAVTGTGTVTIGTSTSGTGLTPFSQYYESGRTQFLVMASDLIAAGLTPGTFSNMAFNVSTKNSTLNYVGYTIKLAHTTATSLSGYLSPTFTTVYGPVNYATTSGANVFPMSGGFSWNGTSNLLVEVCYSNATGTYSDYSYNDIVTGTTKSYTATYGTYDDGAYLCTSTGSGSASSSNLPNITFSKNGCVSSRSPVVATVNPLPTPTISPATGPVQICAGNVATFTGGGGGTYQWRDASGPISGATGGTFSVGANGSYRVIVTNSFGCKDSSVSVAVNVNPTPSVSILPAGTNSICADSAQKFTSILTGSGLTYQWFNGATAITGATRDSLITTNPGVYTLRVYLGTCSDTSNQATLIVNPLPASSFAKTGTTGAICLGSTLELTALTIPTSSSYQWSLNGIDIPGATAQIFNASTGGIYTVRIKDANNCRKTSDTMSVINTPMGIPKLSPNELRFCEGTDVMLYSNAGPFAASYIWSKDGVTLGDTTSTIVAGALGIYDVTVTDVYGCTLTSTKSYITVDPLPIKPVIVKTGALLSTSNPYSTYQWYRNGKAIAGATLRNYTISFDGKYNVVVTNNAGCINESDVLSVQGLSVKQIVKDEVNIDVYPNPSQDIINIVAPIEVNLFVKDIQGKQIVELKNAKQVDMSAYADGIYIFTITDKEGVVVKMDKVVKRTN